MGVFKFLISLAEKTPLQYHSESQHCYFMREIFKWGTDCDAKGIKGKSASDPTLIMWGRPDHNETIWGLCVCICLILSIRNSSSNKQAFCPPIYLRTDQDALDITHNSFRHSVSMNVCTHTNWLTEKNRTYSAWHPSRLDLSARTLYLQYYHSASKVWTTAAKSGCTRAVLLLICFAFANFHILLFFWAEPI